MSQCIICGKPTPQAWHKYCNEHFQAHHSKSKRSSKKSTLPKGYLEQGYFDERGNLRPELIGKHAKYIAVDLYKSGMKAASLRRFFGKIKVAQRRLESKKDFQAILPNVMELEPYVTNAVTRGVVPQVFQEFIEKNLELAVKSEKDFSKGFSKHFEYVVAFFPKA